MKTVSIVPLLAAAILTSCHNADFPLKVNFKQAAGKVIGNEVCDSTGSSIWLVSVVDSISESVSGVPIFYRGGKFNHVVKVYGYDLSKEYIDSTSLYFFQYYNTKEDKSVCDTDITASYDIPGIEIKAVYKLNR